MRGHTGLSAYLGGPQYVRNDLSMIGRDHIVGKTQHQKSLMLQPDVPALIATIVMERTIGFDDQTRLVTEEISHIGSNRRLPAELQTSDGSAT